MTQPNAETVNDLVKRFHHRLVARELARNPVLLEEARAILAPRPGRSGGEPFWIVEWRKLLSRPLPEVRREITRPTERMTLLRSGSPFAFVGPDFTDVEQRRLLWRRMRAFAVRRGL